MNFDNLTISKNFYWNTLKSINIIFLFENIYISIFMNTYIIFVAIIYKNINTI